MQMLKMQLNTAPTYTRDMTVQLTSQVSGKRVTAKPYLDGSVVVPNLEPGPFQVQVIHPNLLFPVHDAPIVVQKDRPTFVPITIPSNIFENVPIRDTPEADLGPVQARLDRNADSADLQADKLGGQPIYADDWNQLATTMGEVARSTREMTGLVSPIGHDHPELEEKLAEIQNNLQRMFDVFGEALAQLQRQMQQLALQSKVETALDKVPSATPEVRREMEDTVRQLADNWQVSPGTYSVQKRRAAQQVQERLSLLLADADPAVRDDPDVQDLDVFTQAMATEQSVVTYEQEIGQQQRTGSKSRQGLVFNAFRAGRVGGI